MSPASPFPNFAFGSAEASRWRVRFQSHLNLHFLNASVNMKDCIVTWTDDGFVFNDDNLCGTEEQWSKSHPEQLVTFCHYSGLRDGRLTWASKVRPEWQRFSVLHRMKPGRISSSSMPFSRSLRFSPGPASSVSTSSDRRLNTSTTCCAKRRHDGWRSINCKWL